MSIIHPHRIIKKSAIIMYKKDTEITSMMNTGTIIVLEHLVMIPKDIAKKIALILVLCGTVVLLLAWDWVFFPSSYYVSLVLIVLGLLLLLFYKGDDTKALEKHLEKLKKIIDSGDYRKILLSLLRGAVLKEERFGYGQLLKFDDTYYVLLRGKKGGLEKLNKRIKNSSKRRIFARFSGSAGETIMAMLAPEVKGLDHVKRALLTLLFSRERLHILLLGDPGTGKSALMRGVSDLAPTSSFGLGSGTSNRGLTVTMRGNKVLPGLLPLADGGIAVIDELNLMKKEDRGGLYNAMSKGFVAYDKSGKHVKFQARCSLLAAANPKDDVFKAGSEEVKGQLPFDEALISRFHLVYIIRKHSVEEFLKVTESIINTYGKEVGGDKPGGEKELKLLKDYIAYANGLDVKFDSAYYKDRIKDFVSPRANSSHHHPKR